MINFEVVKTQFDKNFIPDHFSRSTTNLINLSKNPKNREANISLFFSLINNQINTYLNGNSHSNRYQIHLSILRTNAWFKNKSNQFPVSEMLEIQVEDTLKKKNIPGPIGLNFSSYLRDFDFHANFPKIVNNTATSLEKSSFGQLHGILYKLQFKKYNPNGMFNQPAVIVISVSENKEYVRVDNPHPWLGDSYIEHGGPSITSSYFKKMGLIPSFFMPKHAVAPLAFFHEENNLTSRNEIELCSLIAVMETLQKIYRPEIYSSNSKASNQYTPSLQNKNFTPPLIQYDRDERNNTLIGAQSAYVEEQFIKPNNDDLEYLNQHYLNLYPKLSFN